MSILRTNPISVTHPVCRLPAGATILFLVFLTTNSAASSSTALSQSSVQDNTDFKGEVTVAVQALIPEGALVAGRGGVTSPLRTREVLPNYPSRARREGIEGKVGLLGLVRHDGTISDVQVVGCSQSGYGFEKAALGAVQKWQYAPALHRGKPVDAYLTVFVIFDPGDYSDQLKWNQRETGLKAFARAELFSNGTHVAGEKGVSLPVLKKRHSPLYPRGARMRSIESKVILLVLVRQDGTVAEIPLAYAERIDFEFKEAATDAVTRWRFEPATKDGEPVDAYHWIHVDFPS